MLKRHRRTEKSKTPIEEIIKKTPVEKYKKHLWIEGAALALPLVVSFAFYVSLIFKRAGNITGAYLSPKEDIQALVFFVFAFIIIYSIFLIFEYGNLKKKLKEHKVHLKK